MTTREAVKKRAIACGIFLTACAFLWGNYKKIDSSVNPLWLVGIIAIIVAVFTFLARTPCRRCGTPVGLRPAFTGDRPYSCAKCGLSADIDPSSPA
jgi:hypothetical protein